MEKETQFKNLGYTTTKSLPLDEIHCHLSELTHDQTGARILHIDAPSKENVFSILFPTRPTSSNGIAHILEHTVLCGSKKFPVKDPFFNMIRRSLNTFMNAMTGSDFTCYPAASLAPKDFYNLLDVYIDAVFSPLLNELSFHQEGWRHEFEEGKLKYKGIVFNEMKGALSNPTTRLYEALHEKLFPTLTYGVNSGGDPKNIPELTYSEFKTFWEESYHPSRAIFYFYGDIPLEQHLSYLNERLLNEVKKKDPLPPIPREKRYDTPQSVVKDYPLSEAEIDEEKGLFALSWLTVHLQQQKEVLALTLIDEILMDNDASPLKRRLLESGLCKVAGTYVDTDVTEVPFYLICQGVKPENKDKLEAFILDALKEIAEEGLDKGQIDSALHQLELNRREIAKAGSYPYGLVLFFRSALLSLHGGKAEYGLLTEQLFDELRTELDKNPRYLEDLLVELLIRNSHRVSVMLKPSPALQSQEEQDEQTALQKMESALSKDQRREIQKKAEELAEFQKDEENQDLSVLPLIKTDEIPKEIPRYPLHEKQLGEAPLYHREIATNGLIYSSIIYDLPTLDAEQIPYISLLRILLPELGSGGRSFQETLEDIQKETGGIYAHLSMNARVEDFHQFTPSMHISGKALTRKRGKFLELLKESCQSVDFSDLPRIREVCDQVLTSLEASLSKSAMKYAIGMATAPFSKSTALSQQWFGLPFLLWLKSDKVQAEIKSGKIREILEELYQQIFVTSSPRDYLVTSNEADFQLLEKEQFFGLSELQNGTPKPLYQPLSFETAKTNSAYTFTSQVSYSVLALPSPTFTDPATAPLFLTQQILDNQTLHPLIREKGGAYGSNANHDPQSGYFTMTSFRDPNIAATYEAFETALDRVSSGDFTNEILDDAKREVVQGLDSPLTPESEGMTAYHWKRSGKTDELRQEFRSHILSCDRDEVARVTKEQLQDRLSEGKRITFSGRPLVESENTKLKTPFEVIDIK